MFIAHMGPGGAGVLGVHSSIFMPQTSKKLRVHIGLGLSVFVHVRPLRFAYGQDVEIGS